MLSVLAFMLVRECGIWETWHWHEMNAEMMWMMSDE